MARKALVAILAILVSIGAARADQLSPGDSFRDCDGCPVMVVVPAGRFTMGSPESEAGRADDEGPRHEVRIAKDFAIGQFEVTRDQFALFAGETGHNAGDGCWTLEYIEPVYRADLSWRNPGFTQKGDHPAVCISWDDANAYVRWLNGKVSGKPYRLLSESEWEYVARAGTTTVFSTGATISTDQANFDGKNYTYGNSRKGKYLGSTASVGSYPANRFDVHDMHGNAWEWTQDCLHESYRGAPADGSAWTSSGDCSERVLRGGSWIDEPWVLRSADRFGDTTDRRDFSDGFRVARTLPH